MHVHDGANLRLVGLRAVKGVIDGKEVPVRKLVDPLDEEPLTASCLDRRPGHRAVVGPHARRRHVAVNAYERLPHRYAVVGELPSRVGADRGGAPGPAASAATAAGRRSGPAPPDAAACGRAPGIDAAAALTRPPHMPPEIPRGHLACDRPGVRNRATARRRARPRAPPPASRRPEGTPCGRPAYRRQRLSMFSIVPAIVSNEPPGWMRSPPSQLSSTNLRIEVWSVSVWST